MKILVTGASGFIGKNLVEVLRKTHMVRAFVRSERNIPGIEEFVGDITDAQSVSEAANGMDAIYHLAAIRGEKNIPYSEYEAVNIGGTRNVVGASGGKRLIHVSTVGVAGLSPGVSEETVPHPSGKYHASKLEAEKIVAGNRKATIVRPAITYGPGDLSGMVFRISKMLKAGNFSIAGNGRNRVHLLSIDNLIPFLVSILSKKESYGQTYIVADPEPISMNDLCGTIACAIGKEAGFRHLPLPLVRAGSHILKLAGSSITPEAVDIVSKDRYFRINKAISIGYRPSIRTRDGIRKTVEWYLEKGAI